MFTEKGIVGLGDMSKFSQSSAMLRKLVEEVVGKIYLNYYFINLHRQSMVAHIFIPALGGRGLRISVIVNLIWSAYQVFSQPGLYIETLSQKTAITNFKQ